MMPTQGWLSKVQPRLTYGMCHLVNPFHVVTRRAPDDPYQRLVKRLTAVEGDTLVLLGEGNKEQHLRKVGGPEMQQRHAASPVLCIVGQQAGVLMGASACSCGDNNNWCCWSASMCACLPVRFR